MKTHLQYGKDGIEVDIPGSDVTVLVPQFVEGLSDEAAGFREAVRKHSKDVTTKPLGGDVGWIGKQESWDPAFIDAAFTLKTLRELAPDGGPPAKESNGRTARPTSVGCGRDSEAAELGGLVATSAPTRAGVTRSRPNAASARRVGAIIRTLSPRPRLRAAGEYRAGVPFCRG